MNPFYFKKNYLERAIAIKLSSYTKKWKEEKFCNFI